CRRGHRCRTQSRTTDHARLGYHWSFGNGDWRNVTAAPATTPHAMSPSDGELIGAVAKGDLQALGSLFERHEPAVRRYLGRLGIAAVEADDLVQAVFLEVVRASERFDAAYSARSWLFGIATIMVRRQRRSTARIAARMAAWAGMSRADEGLSPTPGQILEHDEVARVLSAALRALSAKKREVFVLVALGGLNGEEAARALGIPLKTVWTRLHYARRELRAALREAP